MSMQRKRRGFSTGWLWGLCMTLLLLSVLVAACGPTSGKTSARSTPTAVAATPTDFPNSAQKRGPSPTPALPYTFPAS